MPTKVKFVEWGEQAKVKIVDYGEDMQVIPVEYGEQMKVKVVQYGEQIKVKIVEDTSFCFITNACVEARNLPDDCPELTAMRGFRDNYMLALPNGDELLHEYYEVAPRIVEEINKTDNQQQVYSSLYEKLLSIIELINSGDNDEALRNYLKMVNDLKKRYLKM